MRARLPLTQPGRRSRLLFVHAHPDDELLATGVAMAHHLARGDEVHVLTATLGEEGEVIPPELRHLEGSPWLGHHRRAELAAAMASLGVTSHTVLGERPGMPDGGRVRWRDSGMAGSPSASHPRAWSAADPAERAEAVCAEIMRLHPDVVVTYDATGGYGHPDHIATHDAVVRALRLIPRPPVAFQVLTPVSWDDEHRRAAHALPALATLPPLRGGEALELPGPDRPGSVVPDDEVTHAVVDPSVTSRVIRALEHHRTQVTVLADRMALSNRVTMPLPWREGFARLSI